MYVCMYECMYMHILYKYIYIYINKYVHAYVYSVVDSEFCGVKTSCSFIILIVYLFFTFVYYGNIYLWYQSESQRVAVLYTSVLSAVLFLSPFSTQALILVSGIA